MDANTINPFDVVWTKNPSLAYFSMPGFPVGTDANTAQKDLSSFSFIGDHILGVGTNLRLWGQFSCAANTNSKTMKVIMGGQDLFTITTTSNAQIVYFDLTVRNQDEDNLIVTGIRSISVALSQHTIPLTQISFSNPLNCTIRATGQNAVAAANDIVLNSFSVNLNRV